MILKPEIINYFTNEPNCFFKVDKIKIPTSFNIELDFEMANLLHRFLAWLIDFVIQVAYLLIAMWTVSYFFAKSFTSHNSISDGYNTSAIYMIAGIPVLLYHLLSEVIMNGQSVGKKVLGIKVISETGNRPSFYQFLLRWLVRPFDVTSFGLGVFILSLSAGKNEGFVFIIYLLVLVAAIVILLRKNKRLGDMAAGTLVIVSRVKADINNTVFFDLEESYKPRYENVLRLSDRDMNIIKTILETSLKQKNYEFAERTSAKIRTALQITDYQHPVEFLETILKDYNYLSNKN